MFICMIEMAFMWGSEEQFAHLNYMFLISVLRITRVMEIPYIPMIAFSY